MLCHFVMCIIVDLPSASSTHEKGKHGVAQEISDSGSTVSGKAFHESYYVDKEYIKMRKTTKGMCQIYTDQKTLSCS